MSTVIETAQLDNILFITLNRPEKYNAFNEELVCKLTNELLAAEENNDIKVIVLRANGHYFSAGIDLEYLGSFLGNAYQKTSQDKSKRAVYVTEEIKKIQQKADILAQLKKPVIAAVQGPCIGLGFGLVCGADIILATSEASFSIKEVDLGIVADIGTLQRLPHSIPLSVLKYAAMTGEALTSHQLHRIGFIHHVCHDQDDLIAHCTRIAASLTQKNNAVLQGIKAAINSIHEEQIQKSFLEIACQNGEIFSTETFLEKLQKVLRAFKK